MKLIHSPYRDEYIDNKKEQLYRLFVEKGHLDHPEVVAMSQELDELILSAQRQLCS